MGQPAEVLNKAKSVLLSQAQKIRALETQIRQISEELRQKTIDLAALNDQLRQQQEALLQGQQEIEALRNQLPDDHDKKALDDLTRLLSPEKARQESPHDTHVPMRLAEAA